MKVLFDQGTPAPLRLFLIGHVVVTAHELGWSELKNGELLAAAEAKFDVFVTTDRNLRYQQNLSGRKLSILVLPTTSWPKLQGQVQKILAGVDHAAPGGYLEIAIGREP